MGMAHDTAGETATTETMIYKIFRAAEYADFVAHGQSKGAAVDLADGYIHFSTAAQVAETAAKHFQSEDGLWLLACPATLDLLRWEPSRGGALFPHLYRPLRREDVVWSRPLALTPQGHDFGELL